MVPLRAHSQARCRPAAFRASRARRPWTLLRALLALAALAVPCLLASRAPAQQYPFVTYPPDALPQAKARKLLQDHVGYLWVATDNGVARYDGTEFAPFGMQSGMRSGWVIALAEDQAGHVWLGTQDGASRFDGERFETWGLREGLGGRQVWLLATGSAGTVYAGTREAPGVTALRLGPEGRVARVEVLDLGEPSGITEITALAATAEDTLFVGTEGGGLRVLTPNAAPRVYGAAQGFPGTRITEILLAPHRTATYVASDAALACWAAGELKMLLGPPSTPPWDVRALAVSPSGGLLISTRDGGLYEAAGAGCEVPAKIRKVAQGPPSAEQVLAVDQRGIAWRGTEGTGLHRIDTATGVVAVVDHQHGLEAQDISDLLVDREGTLWVGTSAGLAKLLSNAFVNYSARDGVPPAIIRVIRRLPSGSGGLLLVGTQDRLSLFDGAAWRSIGRAEGLQDDGVTSLAVASPRRFFVGGSDFVTGGITQVDLQADGAFSFRRFDRTSGLPSGRVYAMAVDAAGSLLAGTAYGLSRLEADRFTAVPLPAARGGEKVYAVLPDNGGRVWVGSTAGLTLLDGQRSRRFTRADGLKDDFIVDLAASSDGALWVVYGNAVGASLVRPDPAEGMRVISHLSTAEGLPTDFLYFAGVDAEDTAWFGSPKGLLRYREGTVATLTMGDGLVWNDCAWHAFFADTDGTIWVGTGKGLSHYLPRLERALSAPLDLVWRRVLLGGTGASAGTNVPYPRRDLEADFSALSFVDEASVSFRHRLVGYRDLWSTFSPARTVSFTNLPPGAYRLEVEAQSRHGVSSARPLAFSFEILPPYYMRSWFRSLVALAALAVLASGYQLRVARLRARQRRLEATVASRTGELAEANEGLQAAVAKLREVDRAKTELFTNISHEFRTPLTLILGPLEQALAGAFDGDPGALKRQMTIMMRNSRRLLRLINQLLDLAKLEAGAMKIEARHGNLCALLRTVVASFESHAQAGAIALQLSCSQDNFEVYFDPHQLEKVFFNLLSNAFKFTGSGGQIAISVMIAEKSVRVRVADTGMGIPHHELPFIFNRFRQVDGSASRQHEGTGVGLALVKELVELHHGKVSVDSSVGVGTTFTVTLPLGREHLAPESIVVEPGDDVSGIREEQPGWDRRRSPGGSPPNVAAEPRRLADRRRLYTGEIELAALQPGGGAGPGANEEPSTTAPATAATVLIVEDNPDMRTFVSSVLAPHFRIVTAANGVEGLHAAVSSTPDVIVADMMMPLMNGHELLRELKSRPDTQRIPFMLLTAKSSESTPVEALDIGADDYLAKPFNAKELVSRARALVRLTAMERDLTAKNAELQARIRADDEQWATLRAIREGLAPKTPLIVGGLQVAALSRSAAPVNCDYCDFFGGGDGSSAAVAIAVGRVRTAGAAAGLLITTTKALTLGRATRCEGPSALVSGLSRDLRRLVGTTTPMSFLYCVARAEDGAVQFANAGQPYPIQYRSASGEVIRLWSGGPLLTAQEDHPYRLNEATLAPGDLLVLITDGVTETPGATGEVYGFDRLARVIAENAVAPTDLPAIILDHVAAFRRERDSPLDLTAVALWRRAKA